MYCLLLLLTILTGDPPPGTIQIGELYVDKEEITNNGWLEFLFYMKQDIDSVQYQQYLPHPDNTWYNKWQAHEMPIVLITYEQAIAFCQWRSEVVSKSSNRKVNYRLPTPEEWQEVARYTLENYGQHVKRQLKKTYKFIQKYPDSYNVMKTFSRSYMPTQMFDNVSEMTSEPGLAMGANNFYLLNLESNLNSSFSYERPNSYIGFRCVAEYEEEAP